MKLRKRLAGGLLLFYRNAISPALHALAPGGCRFQPTCSEYAAIAVAEWGWLRGGWMALLRLLRCHPLSKGGFDPVPARRDGHGVAGKLK
ncbi:MAG: membrane protein insertion efficiency factor YidD [Acidobacteriaceae bacterium]